MDDGLALAADDDDDSSTMVATAAFPRKALRPSSATAFNFNEKEDCLVWVLIETGAKADVIAKRRNRTVGLNMVGYERKDKKR
mmetsp:Transcript_20355/g.29433  ORF Transcript_20355/g.29433 Transcript_20355/m.29433 type:complete len:83 (+) Transcript_20355:264-512(+)|eukprot:CAMPEP_0202453318 /NCGR_PEP_ID=MMETSP1360-20130828/11320_1 /ASSEMBLY_ACC=CAM_ASM_000848 /TAXON_ID=515479 /ORGANISM="Licmophora paradoxa, Strain CCMP2313" /LENGTH=82 /DNA_ID=CAMNT_0049072383 /DNA_START=379 /DNA_END=627 /DNA_ORIENTATION=-